MVAHCEGVSAESLKRVLAHPTKILRLTVEGGVHYLPVAEIEEVIYLDTQPPRVEGSSLYKFAVR